VDEILKHVQGKRTPPEQASWSFCFPFLFLFLFSFFFSFSSRGEKKSINYYSLLITSFFLLLFFIYYFLVHEIRAPKSEEVVVNRVCLANKSTPNQTSKQFKNHQEGTGMEEAALTFIASKGISFLDEETKRLRMIDVLALVDELERRFFPLSLSQLADDLLFFRPPTLPELINTLSQRLETHHQEYSSSITTTTTTISSSSSSSSSSFINSTSEKKRRKKRTVLLFPGQGAQRVGMAKGVAEHPKGKKLFEKAKEILGYDLLNICLNGPEELLSSTEISQPALFVTSLAALEKWKEEIEGDLETEHEVMGYAGLSLGEYTAITASGMLSFEEGLKLVQIRGKAMQRACDLAVGGMASVLGYNDTSEVMEMMRKAKKEEESKAVGLVGEQQQQQQRQEEEEEQQQQQQQKGTLDIACLLCPGNIVVSGTPNLLNRLDSLVKKDAEESGAKVKLVRLLVAGAFHTSAMGEALPSLREAIEKSNFQPPTGCTVVASNSNGRLTRDPETVKKNLLTQLCQPVLWQQVIESLVTFVNSKTTSNNSNNNNTNHTTTAAAAVTTTTTTTTTSNTATHGIVEELTEFVELGTSAAVVTGLVRRILTATSVQNVSVRLVAV